MGTIAGQCSQTLKTNKTVVAIRIVFNSLGKVAELSDSGFRVHMPPYVSGFSVYEKRFFLPSFFLHFDAPYADDHAMIC